MINIKKRFIATALLSCSLFGLTSCSSQPFMASMQGRGVPVEAITLQSVPVAQSSIYQANLISRFSVNLQPQIAGQVASIYVKAGDHVRAGQLLMIIDKRKQEASLNSTHANASAAKASISQAQSMLHTYKMQRESFVSNLALNKKMYDRYNALYAKKSVSQQDLEKYTDSYNKAKADLDANTAQIQAQESTIETAKSEYDKALYSIKEQEVQLQYYKITAPYSGIIG